ncbi:LCP family protein [Streptomyces achromogenes]|uniref:LCP family protein n=1 Tax=Streptomyces achromogenes TaxID=67255 RepID=UPI0036B70014
MTDPWDGPAGRGTRSRGARVPRPRTAGQDRAGSPAGRGAVGARAGRRPGEARPAGRGRRLLRTAAITLSLIVVLTAGAGWLFYRHLDGNLHSVSLDGKGGTEKADAFGRTPLNILVMGSDGRTSTTDCRLGGGCSRTGVQTGANADVQMVLHISADRSNATVLSIPRDTMTRVPACRDGATGRATTGYYGQVNSALRYGPGCQVATVHRLTGIPVDHFVELDFSGVVKMSDAVGGVSVCVSDDVYDTYSHLKLSRGTHTLKGVAALEFVRSRHGFGDGSDLGRTVAQHIFLSAMIRKFKSAGTLTDPTAVYRLADAATKALTVDDGLGSVKKLIGLAADVNKVPARRITFATMQTAPDPADHDRVVAAPGAASLFAAIADDRPLTTGNGAHPGSTARAAASAEPAARIAVTVRNGTGITGRARALADALTDQGFRSATTGNASGPATTTTLTYGPGHEAAARTVARALGLPSARLEQGTGTGLTLVVGSDWPSGNHYPGTATAAPAPAGPKAAVGGAHASTADQGKTCAKVSPYKTVTLDGVAMTPAQAYTAARGRPDSDVRSDSDG